MISSNKVVIAKEITLIVQNIENFSKLLRRIQNSPLKFQILGLKFLPSR